MIFQPDYFGAGEDERSCDRDPKEVGRGRSGKKGHPCPIPSKGGGIRWGTRYPQANGAFVHTSRKRNLSGKSLKVGFSTKSQASGDELISERWKTLRGMEKPRAWGELWGGGARGAHPSLRGSGSTGDSIA